MKFTPTNHVSHWIIHVCLSHHAQIPPLWLTQVKHIHEITKFSNQPSILFHLVLICRNTRLHLFHSLFWTHTTFNLLVLFKETYIYGGDEFQYTAWFQGHCVCWQTFQSFFSLYWTLKREWGEKLHYLSMHQNPLCNLWCFNGFQGRFDYQRNIIE